MADKPGDWRMFDPPVRHGSYVTPSQILLYDSDDEVSRLFVSRKKKPVAIFIDGACRGNGTEFAKGAYGVYHGQGSRYNAYGCLPHGANHTSQVAEIYAAQKAVNIIGNNLGGNVCQDGVVIITDSDYLFKSMTMYIYNWVRNGFLNAKGGPVVNGDSLSALHYKICDLEVKGINIRFWRVDRWQNQEADSLADMALGL